MMLKSRLYEATGFLTEAGIRLWVQWTGKRVSRESAAWLQCPMGSRGRIGQEFYAHLAQREGLRIEASDHAGLLDDFNALKGGAFDPELIHPRIRDFYERTTCYRMEAWSEVGLLSRFFLWFLV